MENKTMFMVDVYYVNSFFYSTVCTLEDILREVEIIKETEKTVTYRQKGPSSSKWNRSAKYSNTYAFFPTKKEALEFILTRLLEEEEKYKKKIYSCRKNIDIVREAIDAGE